MTLQTLLDRFDLLMDTPESVPKLRRFILQLAVRGRLSDRRASDEPAETLVERMEAEKERLDAAGEYKYQKTMPPIEKDDIPFSFSVPKGWTWVRLGNLGKVYGGGTPKKSNSAYWGGEIPWVSPKDMSGAVIQSTEDKITQKGLEESSAKLVPPGSLLIVGRSGILERKLPVAVTAVECTANQDLKVLTPFVSGMARYIRLILKGFEPHILDELVKTGTTVRSLKYTEFQLHSYPLPPIDEQQRIVETVDGLMDECDALEEQQEREHALQVQVGTAATEALQSADDAESLRPAWERVRGHFDTVTATPEGVNALRQTILQLAVQGRLTKHAPSDTPVDSLLERVEGQKQRLYEEGKVSKPKSKSAVKDEPFTLPEDWTWVRLCRIAKVDDPNPSHRMPEYVKEGIPFISAESLVGRDSIDFSSGKKVKQSTLSEQIERFSILPGSFALSRIGTIGKTRFLPRERTYCMSHSLCVISPYSPNSVSPDYLRRVVSSGLVLEQAVEGTQSIGVPDLGMGVIRSFKIPLPSKEEQERIADILDHLVPLCDSLEDQLLQQNAVGDRLLSESLLTAGQERETLLVGQ